MYRPIEVLLADDHEIFRDGLNLMFKKNPDINLIGEAGNGEELMKLARKLNPDVIIMDIQMPVMNGIEATKLLTSEMPHIGIIALSIMEDDYQIVEMLEAGARGYLLKNAHKNEIIEAIKAVYKDQNYYCNLTTEKLEKMVAGSHFSPSQLIHKPEFSEREIEIIRLICDGKSSKGIGALLNLSYRTVEWHRNNILKKIDTKKTVGIVIYAIKHKIYEPPQK